jgi:hypothetical protein
LEKAALRGAGCRGEKTPQLEKGVIKADLVLPLIRQQYPKELGFSGVLTVSVQETVVHLKLTS